MKHLHPVILFILVSITTNQAQTGFIPLSIDHAIFKAEKNKVYLEIYLSFNESHLQYIDQDQQYMAEYMATAQILQGDSLLFQDVDKRKSQLDSMNEISAYRKFLNIFGFIIDDGSYSAKITVQDLHSPRKGEYIFDFEARPFPEQELMISDIELCSHISADTAKGDFQKNSFLVIPNPGSIFSVNIPVVYYYAELYNLKMTTGDPGQYKLRTSIRDLEGNSVKEYPEKIIKKPGETAVLVGGHNIVTLLSSTYFFNIEIEDLDSREITRTSKRFTFFKPETEEGRPGDSLYAADKETVSIAEYLQYGEEELLTQFEKTRYISTKKERDIFKNLNLDGKRVFLARFWKKFDPTPATEVNEFKQNYTELINFAETNFSSMNKKGWETDRGRVLLSYGSPDEIERFYMAIDMKPHEIWHYHELEGGVLFVFADLSGFGDFELLHSTYSKELYQPDWERLVRRTQGGFDYER
ncbi:MAG: GWxTD domain-containing protein [Calditrichaeota bacterium]|nr:GWxTD domain-containing protein [Calditrichota bacterium]